MSDTERVRIYPADRGQMELKNITTKYLLRVMLHICVMAIMACVLNKKGITLGYDSVIGVVLIVLAGISSAFWGIVYQCKYNENNLLQIGKDFLGIKQSLKCYLIVLIFLLIVFGGTIFRGEFQAKSIWDPVLLFLKAIAFGGIEEIGWRYTFQPAMERIVAYVSAVILTFLFWGIWHLLFFYIDGSFVGGISLLLFLLGLLTNCFILSALYAYSGSLWICVMTHALINALSQITVPSQSSTDGHILAAVAVDVMLKAVCIILAIRLYSYSKGRE